MNNNFVVVYFFEAGDSELMNISVSNLKPKMKISKSVINEAGMMLVPEGTELTDTLINRLQNMNISRVNVEGESMPKKSKEEMLFDLDLRFKKTENEPYMNILKRLLEEHIEELSNKK